MKERVITGAILVAFLLIIGIINNAYLIGLVISVITILGMYEAKKLFDVKNEKVFYILSLLSILSIFVNPLFIAVLGVVWVGGYIAYFQKELKLISISLYPFLSLLILFELYLKTSIGVIGWLIVIVALTDSLAYFIGKNFGKKFIQQGFCKTSPNKSWEGVIGGVVLSTIISSFVGLVFVNFISAFLISFVVSVASVFGDLFESYLKRKAGVKDSGNILPGHGGVLDRIDGYLFAAPVMWAIIGAIY